MVFIVLIFFMARPCVAEWATYSAQFKAMTSNAGGQTAYSLKRGTDTSEYSLFMNEYLLAGGKPVIGATYNWRYALCGIRCFWQFYAQIGGGLSTGGPLLEITWSTILLWTARIDFTTQMYTIPFRFVTWSYPLWLGISVPLPY